MSVKVATDDTFKDLLESKKLILLKAGATWCGPCRAIKPTLDSIASERAHDLDIIDMDIDDCPSSSMKFKIMGVPTLILIKDGEELSRKVGNMPKNTIESWINAFI